MRFKKKYLTTGMLICCLTATACGTSVTTVFATDNQINVSDESNKTVDNVEETEDKVPLIPEEIPTEEEGSQDSEKIEDNMELEENISDESIVESQSENQEILKEGFIVESGKTFYYEKGVKVTGEKYIENSEGGYWYYFIPEANGEMDTEWSWIPDRNNGGKWCFFDVNGRRMHGQQYIDKHWYMFDSKTGATQYGFVYIPEQNKWVFYDRVMGWMLYGEQCIDSAWYYLDPWTGAVDYDWAWIPTKDKWVYYDPITGKMWYGEHKIDGKWQFLDPITGEVYSKNKKIERVVNKAYSAVGKHIDAPGILASQGGKLCHYGPCMSLVWWMFYDSGMPGHVADGMKSGWPHDNYDWYKNRGRVDYNPQVGDIAFFRYPMFADVEGVSSSHAGLVVGVNGNSVVVIDALDSGIRPRVYSKYSTVGFAHPYY